MKQTDFDGTFEFSDIAEAEFVSAGKFSLEQNYPNPFNPSTQIEFSLPEDANNVKLTVYNTLGQKIAVLVNSPLDAGSYQYNWNAHNEGIYLYELRAEQVCFSQENDSAEMKRPCRKQL